MKWFYISLYVVAIQSVVLIRTTALTEDQNGVCKRNNFNGNYWLMCCQGFRLHQTEDKCDECPKGTYGENCNERCKDGYYGKSCLSKCNCSSTETCDKVKGCVKTVKECPTDMYKASCNEECKSPFTDVKCRTICNCTTDGMCDDADRCFDKGKKSNMLWDVLMAGGIILLSAGLCMTVCYKYHKRETITKPPFILNDFNAIVASPVHDNIEETVFSNPPLYSVVSRSDNRDANRTCTGHSESVFRNNDLCRVQSGAYADIDETLMLKWTEDNNDDIHTKQNGKQELAEITFSDQSNDCCFNNLIKSKHGDLQTLHLSLMQNIKNHDFRYIHDIKDNQLEYVSTEDEHRSPQPNNQELPVLSPISENEHDETRPYAVIPFTNDSLYQQVAGDVHDNIHVYKDLDMHLQCNAYSKADKDERNEQNISCLYSRVTKTNKCRPEVVNQKGYMASPKNMEQYYATVSKRGITSDNSNKEFQS